MYAANVWKRVSTKDVTYNAYIIFHDSGSNQSENIALNHGQAYTCKSDNSVTLEEGYPIIAAYFPDPAVRYYLNGSHFLHNDGTKSDADGNGILSPEEIATIDRFEMNANSLSSTIGAPTDFTGIELFTELTDINLAGTTRVKIMSPSIDLSNNTKLQSINISGADALATLTLPETETLTKVSVTGSVLEALDVIHNPNLETLYIQKNQLGEIDLSQNTALKSLYIQQWPMTVNAQIILTKDVVTAVKEVKSEAQVASVTYYNIVGMSSDKPFSGINVVVTRYTDGTATTSKVIK